MSDKKDNSKEEWETECCKQSSDTQSVDHSEMVMPSKRQSWSYDPSTEIELDVISISKLEIRAKPLIRTNDSCINEDYLRDVILTDRVPVSLSAVAVLGLPYCGKSQVLKKLFKSEIRLKEQFDTGQVAERIKHFEQDRGLSLYPLCVLGGQPHTKYSWSFTSRRYGIAYSVITSVIRRFGVFNLKSIQFSKETSKGVFDDKHLNSHLQWVLDEVEQLLSSIEDQADKIDLLANGFTLVNVFDAGVNKAVYDFLPYLANACDNLVRLVFFSMERDSEHFYDESEPELAYEKYKERNDHRFVMRLRPRMSYLMHFASLGFQPNVPVTEGNTVFIGTWQKNDSVPQQSKQAFTEDTKKKIFQASKAASFRWINEKKHWVEVNVDEPQSLREGCLKIEQLIAQNSAFTCYLPVKWVFLRSLLSSFSVASTSTKVSPVIIEKKEVIMRASFLKMEGEEVDEFLRKFANYGSLVHFPDFEKLAAIVIVDVSKFVQLLSKLYYPVESDELHRKYGILTQKMLTNLVGDPDSIQPHTFMMIVTELGMASTIKDSSMIVIPNKPKLDCGTCYFIPSARTGTEGEERQSNAESLFIHVDCVQFPANVQASIANSIINVNGMCMIACEFSDVLFFESNDGNIKLRIKYRGKKTELTLEKPITVEKKIIKALSDILGACCNALTERRQQIRDLLFNIGLECQQEGKTTYHYLFYNTDPDLCEKCKKIYQQSEIMQLWGAAAKKCKALAADDAARLKKEIPVLSAEDFVCIAKALEIEGERKILEFAQALQISEETLENLKSNHADNLQDWRLIMKVMFKWEEKVREQENKLPSKKTMSNILENIGLSKLVSKLD